MSEERTLYAGVDPGFSGAIVLLGEDGLWVDSLNLKATPHDIHYWFDKYAKNIRFAYLERVNAMRKGDIPQGATSAFKFGTSYGQCWMLLVCNLVPFEHVLPTQWLKDVGLVRRKGESNTAWKNRHKAMAQQVFPSARITHANGDAALLAHLCWTQRA